MLIPSNPSSPITPPHSVLSRSNTSTFFVKPRVRPNQAPPDDPPTPAARRVAGCCLAMCQNCIVRPFRRRSGLARTPNPKSLPPAALLASKPPIDFAQHRRPPARQTHDSNARKTAAAADRNYAESLGRADRFKQHGSKAAGIPARPPQCSPPDSRKTPASCASRQCVAIKTTSGPNRYSSDCGSRICWR